MFPRAWCKPPAPALPRALAQGAPNKHAPAMDASQRGKALRSHKKDENRQTSGRILEARKTVQTL